MGEPGEGAGLPGRARRWVGEVLEGTVTGAEPLPGATTSAVHAVTVADVAGEHRVALRRYLLPEVLAVEPDVAAREAAVLAALGGAALPTPYLLAADPDGVHCDVPAVLMTLLPGRVVWQPADVGTWLTGMAALLPVLHARPVPAGLRRYAPYRQASLEPPAWSARPELWRRAAAVFAGPAPRLPDVLLHRDFHPGNVLWDGEQVSGLVDWQDAAAGPAVVDVGHCRANLAARLGVDVAERFAAEWERLSGQRYDRWADVVAVVGMLDVLRDDPPARPGDVEELLTRAVADVPPTERAGSVS